MITIDNTQFSSNLSLPSILVCMTKVQMIDICKKLDLYVSPNLKKEETARRLAAAMLDEPLNILHQLCKNELQLLDEIVKAGPNQYVIRKIRKTPYKLQKYGLVLTYEDFVNEQWHILMPDAVRTVLAENYSPYLDAAMKGVKLPSPKELRMMSAFRRFIGEE